MREHPDKNRVGDRDPPPTRRNLRRYKKGLVRAFLIPRDRAGD